MGKEIDYYQKLQESSDSLKKSCQRFGKKEIADLIEIILEKFKHWEDEEHKKHFKKHYTIFLENVQNEKAVKDREALAKILETIKRSQEEEENFPGTLTQEQIELLEKYGLTNRESVNVDGRRMGPKVKCYLGSARCTKFLFIGGSYIAGHFYANRCDIIRRNVFKNKVYSNTFENEMYFNTFENEMCFNTFKGKVSSNTFENGI